jgi:hypothetical protein
MMWIEPNNYKISERRTHMREIHERNEVILHIANDLKMLAKLFAVLAGQSSDVGAWRFYSDHQHAAVLLVTGKDSGIVEVLQAAGFECEANRVVVVQEKHRCVSAVRLSTELRANGVEMLDAYTCCSPDKSTVLVLKTTDGSQAVTVLEAMNISPNRLPVSSRELVVAGKASEQEDGHE